MAGILKRKAIDVILGEPLQITKQVADVFQDLKIRYMIGGSLASSLHGIPRATQDIDIVADIKPNNVKELVNILREDFYIDEDMIKQALSHHTSFNIIHLETMFKVDIFILKQDQASKEEMSRRKSYRISEKHNLYLTSAEDIIIQKLHWYKLDNRVSQRQWKDVIGVLQVQGKRLNFDYLKKTANRKDVFELLTQAIEEVKKKIHLPSS